MTVVAAYEYRDGKRVREVSLAEPLPRREPGGFVWIGIADPTEAEMAALGHCFDLHPLALEDARHPHVRPKIEIYDDELFLVARTAMREGDHIRYGNTSIFVCEDVIVTIRTGSHSDHKPLRAKLEASPLLLRYGVDYVLYGVLDFVVANYEPVLESIEEDLFDMERRALDAFLTRAEINRLFSIRRELARFGRIMGPMEEVLERLAHLEHKGFDADVRPYFSDVYGRVRRASARIEGARDSITATLEASSLLEQHRQGEITRQLAAWAAILAVPTAIAGVYGMNFEYMPELHWRYGYFAVLAAILGIAGFLFWRFRRSGWL